MKFGKKGFFNHHGACKKFKKLGRHCDNGRNVNVDSGSAHDEMKPRHHKKHHHGFGPHHPLGRHHHGFGPHHPIGHHHHDYHMEHRGHHHPMKHHGRHHHHGKHLRRHWGKLRHGHFSGHRHGLSTSSEDECSSGDERDSLSGHHEQEQLLRLFAMPSTADKAVDTSDLDGAEGNQVVAVEE